MRKTTKILVLGAAALLAGCAARPLGPTVRVMPAPYKPFEVFQQDHYDCEQYADQEVAGNAERANNRALGAAVIGAALGLGLGAATGDGNAASFGAASGGVIGAAVGADQSERANYGIQRRYDIAYAQCMYSRGNTVPGFRREAAPPAPPPDRYAPPPPRRG